jgi:hypothetical protein
LRHGKTGAGYGPSKKMKKKNDERSCLVNKTDHLLSKQKKKKKDLKTCIHDRKGRHGDRPTHSAALPVMRLAFLPSPSLESDS